MRLFDLTGKVAIVTGGNGGIGLGIAIGLAEAGAKIMIAARDRAKGETALAEIRAIGVEADFTPTSIDDEAQCRNLATATLDRFGRIDILVNNAGRFIRSAPEAVKLADWDAVMRTNLTGAFLCAQAAYPAMKAQGGGKIVNLGSLASLLGSRFGAPYAASKGALVQLTRSLAVSWGKDNIQVNAILPGYVETELSLEAKASAPDFYAATVARTPVGRWGVPDDIAGLAVLLASRASDYMTGAAIPVDGGYSIQL